VQRVGCIWRRNLHKIQATLVAGVVSIEQLTIDAFVNPGILSLASFAASRASHLKSRQDSLYELYGTNLILLQFTLQLAWVRKSDSGKFSSQQQDDRGVVDPDEHQQDRTGCAIGAGHVSVAEINA